MTTLFKVLLLFSSLNILSHEFNPAHLSINESLTETNSYEAKWLYPVKNIGERAEIIFPYNCDVETKSPYVQGKYIVEDFNLTCSENIKGKSIQITNLSVLSDALISINFKDNEIFETLVTNKQTSIEIPYDISNLPIAYLNLGVEHLLSGIDHILFILGLLFLVRGVLNIIKTITAFTIAHSITLGLSVFNIINLPQSTIEILIALTIIYLALEIKDLKKIKYTPWTLAFSFGLLHGLGFAGALNEIGIANENILLSLLFFNVGIEIGQILFIPLFSIFIWISHKYKFYQQTSIFSSYLLGGMGFYWFISRFVEIII